MCQQAHVPSEGPGRELFSDLSSFQGYLPPLTRGCFLHLQASRRATSSLWPHLSSLQLLALTWIPCDLHVGISGRDYYSVYPKVHSLGRYMWRLWVGMPPSTLGQRGLGWSGHGPLWPSSHALVSQALGSQCPRALDGERSSLPILFYSPHVDPNIKCEWYYQSSCLLSSVTNQLLETNT